MGKISDEKRDAVEQLEAMLLEGLGGAESGMTPFDWSEIRREALAKIEARKQRPLTQSSSPAPSDTRA